LVQFISYEGEFTASSGAATGVRSQNIGIAENSSTPSNWSLQLSGSGSVYSDFTWQAAEHTSGAVNSRQSFKSTTNTPIAQVTEPPTLLLWLFFPFILIASHRNKDHRKYNSLDFK